MTKNPRALGTVLAVIAIGVGGVFWSGCGGDSNSTESITNQAKEEVKKGSKQAEEAVQEGVEKTKKGLNEAKEEVEK
ncbi:MAG TPA: hypothetical protein VFJ65_12565, partial [Solirubrobacterales bacterium]|nr:hypothetical protein [Solirubrobacterales bacterium]